MLVFWIGEEADGSGFSAFNAGEGCHDGLRVSFHCSAENLGYLFGFEFHVVQNLSINLFILILFVHLHRENDQGAASPLYLCINTKPDERIRY